jgi:hypothetical protein
MHAASFAAPCADGGQLARADPLPPSAISQVEGSASVLSRPDALPRPRLCGVRTTAWHMPLPRVVPGGRESGVRGDACCLPRQQRSFGWRRIAAAAQIRPSRQRRHRSRETRSAPFITKERHAKRGRRCSMSRIATATSSSSVRVGSSGRADVVPMHRLDSAEPRSASAAGPRAVSVRASARRPWSWTSTEGKMSTKLRRGGSHARSLCLHPPRVGATARGQLVVLRGERDEQLRHGHDHVAAGT